MLFLAMYGDKIELPQSLFISLFSMLVVFFVLLIISYLIDLTAFVINRKKKETKKVDAVSEKTSSNTNLKNDDVVVIAAAIAAYLGTSVDNIKIKNIRRVNQSNSAWYERGLISQIS